MRPKKRHMCHYRTAINNIYYKIVANWNTAPIKRYLFAFLFFWEGALAVAIAGFMKLFSKEANWHGNCVLLIRCIILEVLNEKEQAQYVLSGFDGCFLAVFDRKHGYADGFSWYRYMFSCIYYEYGHTRDKFRIFFQKQEKNILPD